MRRSTTVVVAGVLIGMVIGLVIGIRINAATDEVGPDPISPAEIEEVADALYIERAINAQLLEKLVELSALIPNPDDEVCSRVIVILPYEDELTGQILEAPWYTQACATNFRIVKDGSR